MSFSAFIEVAYPLLFGVNDNPLLLEEAKKALSQMSVGIEKQICSNLIASIDQIEKEVKNNLIWPYKQKTLAIQMCSSVGSYHDHQRMERILYFIKQAIDKHPEFNQNLMSFLLSNEFSGIVVAHNHDTLELYFDILKKLKSQGIPSHILFNHLKLNKLNEFVNLGVGQLLELLLILVNDEEKLDYQEVLNFLHKKGIYADNSVAYGACAKIGKDGQSRIAGENYLAILRVLLNKGCSEFEIFSAFTKPYYSSPLEEIFSPRSDVPTLLRSILRFNDSGMITEVLDFILSFVGHSLSAKKILESCRLSPDSHGKIPSQWCDQNNIRSYLAFINRLFEISEDYQGASLSIRNVLSILKDTLPENCHAPLIGLLSKFKDEQVKYLKTILLDRKIDSKIFPISVILQAIRSGHPFSLSRFAYRKNELIDYLNESEDPQLINCLNQETELGRFIYLWGETPKQWYQRIQRPYEGKIAQYIERNQEKLREGVPHSDEADLSLLEEETLKNVREGNSALTDVKILFHLIQSKDLGCVNLSNCLHLRPALLDYIKANQTRYLVSCLNKAEPLGAFFSILGSELVGRITAPVLLESFYNLHRQNKERKQTRKALIKEITAYQEHLLSLCLTPQEGAEAEEKAVDNPPALNPDFIANALENAKGHKEGNDKVDISEDSENEDSEEEVAEHEVGAAANPIEEDRDDQAIEGIPGGFGRIYPDLKRSQQEGSQELLLPHFENVNPGRDRIHQIRGVSDLLDQKLEELDFNPVNLNGDLAEPGENDFAQFIQESSSASVFSFLNDIESRNDSGAFVEFSVRPKEDKVTQKETLTNSNQAEACVSMAPLVSSSKNGSLETSYDNMIEALVTGYQSKDSTPLRTYSSFTAKSKKTTDADYRKDNKKTLHG